MPLCLAPWVLATLSARIEAALAAPGALAAHLRYFGEVLPPGWPAPLLPAAVVERVVAGAMGEMVGGRLERVVWV